MLDCMILLMITVWLPHYDFCSLFFLMHLKETLDFTPSPMLFFYLVHLVVVDTISNSVSITDSAFRMVSWDTIPFDLILVILSLTLCLSLSGVLGMKKQRRSAGHTEEGRLICNHTHLSSTTQMKIDRGPSFCAMNTWFLISLHFYLYVPEHSFSSSMCWLLLPWWLLPFVLYV